MNSTLVGAIYLGSFTHVNEIFTFRCEYLCLPMQITYTQNDRAKVILRSLRPKFRHLGLWQNESHLMHKMLELRFLFFNFLVKGGAKYFSHKSHYTVASEMFEIRRHYCYLLSLVSFTSIIQTFYVLH